MKSKVILTIKDNCQYKARWVACGYTQIFGQDYEDTFSPTAQFKSILILLHLIAIEDMEMYTVDIGNAFLESDIDKPLYIIPPTDLCNYLNISNKPIKLKKALYGIKQAGRLWNILITKIYLNYGFK